MSHLLPVFICSVFVTTLSAQRSPDPVPDMGLSQILPLPGKFGGYVTGTGKDCVPKITLLAGEDSTKKILPVITPAPPKGPGEVTFTFSMGCVATVDFGKVPVKMKAVDLGDKQYRPLADLQTALEAGRVVRFSNGYLTILVVDARTQQIAKRLRYTFSDQSTIAWDAQERALIWRGFSVKVE